MEPTIEEVRATARSKTRRLRRRGDALIAAALAFAVGGFAWFGFLGDANRAVLSRGGRANATVVATHECSRCFTPSVTVTFTTVEGTRAQAVLDVSEYARFAVGEVIPVAYDPHSPSRAVSVSDANLPPVAWGAFSILMIGLCLSVYGIRFRWLARHSRKALAGNSTAVLVTCYGRRFARAKRWYVAFTSPQGAGEAARRGLVRLVHKPRAFPAVVLEAAPSRPAIIFGPGVARAWVVIFDCESAQVAIGREIA